MKIFNDAKKWHEKINFVDDNNVFVGFDAFQNCCEDFGWDLFLKEPTNFVECWQGTITESCDPEGFQFDTSYFKEVEGDNRYNEDHAAVFRLVKGEQEIFLVLRNSHNGYYSHGFVMEKDGKIIHEGSL